MKKRLLCALLTLIMLVSLVPAGAMTASAAGFATSEAAITVLKQMEGYKKTCTNGYSGYGTLCTLSGDHSTHEISEKQADVALRAALKELDTAVTSFASANGVALTQSKHDALVLFSFENGTAWTTGTGDFKTAVVSRQTGSKFLNAICRWDVSVGDDTRRMIEANMYLNGVYSTSVPYNFIRINYDPSSRNTDGSVYYGSLNDVASVQYYDTLESKKINVVPTMNHHKFLGWYLMDSATGSLVLINELSSKYNGATLFARWQPNNATDGSDNTDVYYAVKKSALASTAAYSSPNGLELKLTLGDTIVADRDFIDANNNKWLRIKDGGNWVILGKAGSYGSGSSNNKHQAYIDVTVTVTNSYVRSRVNETVYSEQNGTYYKGEKLRIINTAMGDGFLWGQIAASATDNTPIGWVALMYTNWESVKDSSEPVVNNSNAIATAVINVAANNGYVNVRSDAGTNHKIVGAIANGTKVDLYETKYVNGHQWGRCSSGWFCLTYAEVTELAKNSSNKDTGLLSYVFTGKLQNLNIYTKPSTSSEMYFTRETIDPNVTVSQLKADADGNTWGKIPQGWVMISDANGNMKDVKLDVAKYQVTASGLTVRSIPHNDGQRVDTLNKGVEFNVNGTHQIVVVGETIWGYADKVGEDNKTYGGWVNLAGSNVSRNGIPNLKDDEKTADLSGVMGTIVNTDRANIREYTAATYDLVTTLPRGTTVSVWEEEDGWYKIDSNKNGKYDYEEDGWVSGKYLDVYETEESKDSSANDSTSGSAAKVETGLGIVANTYTGVNVRTGAGTGYAAVGKILAGTSVEIKEVKNAGAAKWGRVDQGWICMDYVTMISNYPVAGSTSNNTGSNSSTNATVTEAVVFTGKITAANVNVYKTTSTKSDVVRALVAGDPVTVHELMIVEETTTEALNPETNEGNTTTITTTRSNWARVNDGYIYAPGDNLTLNTLDELTYTVTAYADKEDKYLAVYDSAAGSVKAAKDLEKYDTVSVTTLKIVDGNVWCRVEYTDEEGFNHDGYVKMKYLTRGVVNKPVENKPNNNVNTGNGAGNIVIGSSGNTANQGTNGFVTNAGGYRYTGKVIRTGSVNVRALPSQTAALTTTLKSGAALVIYETTISEGMAWGRCDAGWVYLYYVDLQPCNNAVDAKVVYNENTIIYTDANCSGVAGTYSRMSVVDIYEQVGSMCRTEQGWVHIDNLG